MTKPGLGIGFTSYVPEGADIPAECEDATGLYLGATHRIKGYQAAIDIGLIKELRLMGPEHETMIYRKELVGLGVEKGKISVYPTHNSTFGSVVDLQEHLQSIGVRPREVKVFSSDYHCERIDTFCRHIGLDVQVKSAQSALFQKAYSDGGQEAQLALIEKLQSEIDPEAYLKRVLHEQKGINQFLADPDSYKPIK